MARLTYTATTNINYPNYISLNDPNYLHISPMLLKAFHQQEGACHKPFHETFMCKSLQNFRFDMKKGVL
jgi:hypothetical protein